MKRPKIVVLGSMCRRPVPGVVVQLLHYLLGCERLGFEAYYVEWHGNWVPDPYDAHTGPPEPRVFVGDLMRRYGFEERWICRADHLAPGTTLGGMAPEMLSKLYAEAEALVNVTGAHLMEGEQTQCPRRVYVETDPGIPQIRLAGNDPGMRALVDGHTHHFSFAQALGEPACRLPATDLDYRITRQPIVLDLWDAAPPAADSAYTTVSRWSKRDKSIEFEGQVYRWSKSSEFLDFLDLPRRSGRPLELALSAIPAEDRSELERHGWRTLDALEVCASEEQYRDYVLGSRGEFTIAKDQYVRLRTGWFSDRSACYLAAGRPVITQDTGFATALPTGRGLFAFQTLDDVLEAFETLEADPVRHQRAALEIAREYFDSDTVLRDLLDQIGLAPAGRGA
jgi:hypothetical protein